MIDRDKKVITLELENLRRLRPVDLKVAEAKTGLKFGQLLGGLTDPALMSADGMWAMAFLALKAEGLREVTWEEAGEWELDMETLEEEAGDADPPAPAPQLPKEDGGVLLGEA